MHKKKPAAAELILDALDIHVAVLDKNGVILHTNRAWENFAAQNPLQDGSAPRNAGVGTNYLDICKAAIGSSAESAFVAYRGIQDILEGKKRQFILEYPCHSPREQRWFTLKVSPLKGTRPKQIVVVHTNVTALKLAEFETHRKIQELNQALESLENFAGQLRCTLSLDQSIRAAGSNANPPRAKDTRHYNSADTDRLKLLSKREQEILLALARGERNTDIAQRLALSVKSVSTYRSRVLEKLQVRTTAELVAYMTRIGAV